MTSASHSSPDVHALDSMTGGALFAPTSGERAARVREWLATEPSVEQLQDVFRELNNRDKGAARALREKLDELRRLKGQEAISAEWAHKAQQLLAQARLNIADAMAWQRDAAKAGAALSREPLAGLKNQLAERVRVIEDLQHRVQVQREAAVLLAQRIEVLSTKAWHDAQQARPALQADVAHWQDQIGEMAGDVQWPSVDAKFPPQLEASKAQLLVVWEAFQSALDQVERAAQDPAAELPPVPIWADDIRAQRGIAPAVPGEAAPVLAKPRVDPEIRAQARRAVREALAKLEQEVAEGHGKGSSSAALALRNVLKQHGRQIDDTLENQAHAALSAAGELGDWQRWRADQLREELVAQAEGLLQRPEGQQLGGRKMQDLLRTLREQWKQTDQGGASNHALWKRFDDACNEAHKVVQAWLDRLKLETQHNKTQRQALIDEIKAWTQTHLDELAQPAAVDWKSVSRHLHALAERWREAGHVGEKAYADMQAHWKEALRAAQAPLEQAQKHSLERRQALIEEARQLGAGGTLRIDAVKALQQRWQNEAQGVPLERKHEQKLWDAFRKPIDEAFQRKSAEREKSAQAQSVHDRAVLQAAQALEAANASADAQQIRAAMQALEQALHGAATAAPATEAPEAAAAAADAAKQGTSAAAVDVAGDNRAAAAPQPDAAGAVTPEAVPEATPEVAPEAASAPAQAAAPDATPAAVPVPAKPKAVVAVRGDDRPGQKKSEPAASGRGASDRRPGERFSSRGPDPRGARSGERGAERGGERGNERRPDRAGERGSDLRRSGRPYAAPEERGPRLGDAAFRAQREALDHAQLALKKLSAQAHGETLTRVLAAWAQRDATQLPSAQELGARISPALRSSWGQALDAKAQGEAEQALLRLEMAAEVPTPADQLPARRALQLQMLTRRNDPSPQQTWGLDATRVLGSTYQEELARRLQNALKVLLRK